MTATITTEETNIERAQRLIAELGLIALHCNGFRGAKLYHLIKNLPYGSDVVESMVNGPGGRSLRWNLNLNEPEDVILAKGRRFIERCRKQHVQDLWNERKRRIAEERQAFLDREQAEQWVREIRRAYTGDENTPATAKVLFKDTVLALGRRGQTRFFIGTDRYGAKDRHYALPQDLECRADFIADLEALLLKHDISQLDH